MDNTNDKHDKRFVIKVEVPTTIQELDLDQLALDLKQALIKGAIATTQHLVERYVEQQNDSNTILQLEKPKRESDNKDVASEGAEGVYKEGLVDEQEEE